MLDSVPWLAGLMLLGVPALFMHGRRRLRRQAGLTPFVEFVRRRRELRQRLAVLLGDRFAVDVFVRGEAERLRLDPSTLEALEAALRRAQRESGLGLPEARDRAG